MVWALIAGFLVMFMQAGFALVETGLCRAKNAAHTMSMNFMIYGLGCISFFVYGFAIGWGNWNNGPVAPGQAAPLRFTVLNPEPEGGPELAVGRSPGLRAGCRTPASGVVRLG